MQTKGILPSEIPTEVGDAIGETLDLAIWVRGFYSALKLTGFEPSEALQLTVSAANGLLKKEL